MCYYMYALLYVCMYVLCMYYCERMYYDTLLQLMNLCSSIVNKQTVLNSKDLDFYLICFFQDSIHENIFYLVTLSPQAHLGCDK